MEEEENIGNGGLAMVIGTIIFVSVRNSGVLMYGVRVRGGQDYQPVAGYWYPSKPFHHDSILEMWQG